MSEFDHRAAAPRSIDVFVVTLSDTRSEDTDTSGRAIRNALEAAGHRVAGHRILREDPATLEGELRALVQGTAAAAVIVTGGTGIGPHDLAFDVLARLYERTLPGFGELFRWLSFAEIGSAAIASRASAGVVGNCVLFSIPGSTGAVRLALDRLILPELAHLAGELRRPPGGAG
jgi:molybdenum cofactor biosynthesis protein B